MSWGAGVFYARDFPQSVAVAPACMGWHGQGRMPMLALAQMVNEFVYCPRRFTILASQGRVRIQRASRSRIQASSTGSPSMAMELAA